MQSSRKIAESVSISIRKPMDSSRTSTGLCGILKEIMLERRPRNPEELPTFDYPLLHFFDILGVEAALKLVLCVLLEHQVLVFSSDSHSDAVGVHFIPAEQANSSFKTLIPIPFSHKSLSIGK